MFNEQFSATYNTKYKYKKYYFKSGIYKTINISSNELIIDITYIYSESTQV
jgi:hypothetical protein